MPKEVNIHEAKTHFSSLIRDVMAGQEVIIAKSGKPVARLVPFNGPAGKRRPGSAKGKVIIHDSFFDPLPDDLLDEFERPLKA